MISPSHNGRSVRAVRDCQGFCNFDMREHIVRAGAAGLLLDCGEGPATLALVRFKGFNHDVLLPACDLEPETRKLEACATS